MYLKKKQRGRNAFLHFVLPSPNSTKNKAVVLTRLNTPQLVILGCFAFNNVAAAVEDAAAGAYSSITG